MSAESLELCKNGERDRMVCQRSRRTSKMLNYEVNEAATASTTSMGERSLKTHQMSGNHFSRKRKTTKKVCETETGIVTS
eukprot:5859990-Amphidinium_carterae.1